MKFAVILSTVLLAHLLAALPNTAAVAESSTSREKSEVFPQSVSFYIENDIFFSDRYYTNGIKLLYTGSGDDFYTSKVQFGLLRMFIPESKDSQVYQTVSLGQNMYVPSSINDSAPPLWDRPYAGWLYLNGGAHIARENSLDSLAVSLGIVGPFSFAEQIQKNFHSITDCDTPMGWDTQIDDEFGFIASYSHIQRILRQDFLNNLSSDFLVSFGGDLGNVLIQGTVRAFLRFGYNLPYDFSPTRIDYDSSNDIRWMHPVDDENWHCLFYIGGAFRFVGRNIALNGNTFKHGREVTPEWMVYELMSGVSTRYNTVQLDLNWTLQTAEFTTQSYQPFIFWTLSATVFF